MARGLAVAVAIGVVLLAACTTGPRAEPTAVSYEDYRAVARTLTDFDPGGRITRLDWRADGTLRYTRLEVRYEVDPATGRVAVIAEEPDPTDDRPGRTRSGNGPRPARGRQAMREPSPDGRWAAVCRDWNVRLEPAGDDADGRATVHVTTGGHRKHRYGAASWVYGEEFEQRDAMWWTPDSTKLAYYEFDERDVPDFTLVEDLTGTHTSTLVEGYPKPGDPNPRATLHVYDVATGRSVAVAPPEVPGVDPWYVYAVRFTPDGTRLLYHRTNRRQNELHVELADLETGATTTIVTERQATWQRNRPAMRFLEDGRRFIWETERNGVRQYELRDLDGRLLTVLTPDAWPASDIVRIDELAGWLYYTAHSGAHPLSEHLHRARLDGTGDERLTDVEARHAVRFAPDGRHFVSRFETVETPPVTALYRCDGTRVATLAESEPPRIRALGHPEPELFTVIADDGHTPLYGWLHKPPGFEPSRRYPLVIDVYGGPGSKGVTNRWRAGHAGTAFGFLVAKVDNRGTRGRGKAFLGSVYRQLGAVDLADQAAAVRALRGRPYVDAERVGIYGHSYGGYMAALAVLKYPDVFHVAVAASPVTDWRNYDSIYAERYMQTPAENGGGYEAGSCLTHAAALRGHLLLQHGMRDDNVHPNNTWQLADALQEAGCAFDMMLYPDAAHGLPRHATELRWEYLQRFLF